ncbi:LysR family transcriptional regulator [Pararobbsia silviterrae]|nr:LysR family transcriptional regulator [Pararobbsia silviterrae]
MKDIDLHLISIFDAVMTEGSVTKAAERLAMTQSAVSNAVARMRVVWNDPLFTRSGRGIQPSAKAHALWRELQAPLAQIRTAASPEKFDPATSTRAFRVAVTDYLSSALWPMLRKHIEHEAPGIRILAVPYTSQGTGPQLRNNDIDISIGGLQAMGEDIRLQSLFVEHWVCAMRADHPLARTALTRDDFLDADHLLVSLSGHPVGVADDVLERHGMRRRVAMTLNHFSGVVPLLLASDLISVLPAGVIRTHALRRRIHACDVPLDLPPFACRMAWHTRHERDPAQRWLRGLVIQMCARIWNDRGTA